MVELTMYYFCTHYYNNVVRCSLFIPLPSNEIKSKLQHNASHSAAQTSAVDTSLLFKQSIEVIRLQA